MLALFRPCHSQPGELRALVEQAFTGILLTMNVKANGPAAVYSDHFGEAHELVLS